MFSSPEFIAFQKKCTEQLQEYRNKQCQDRIAQNKNNGLLIGRITFLTNFPIPIGENELHYLQGQSKICYYSMVNTIRRFCVLTHLTENINPN